MKTCLTFAAAALLVLGLGSAAKAQYPGYDDGTSGYGYYSRPLPRMPYGYSFSSYGYNPNAYGYNPNSYGYNPNVYGYNPNVYFSPSGGTQGYYSAPTYRYQTYTYRYGW